MAKKKFNDPLEDIDPIMEQAFSSSDEPRKSSRSDEVEDDLEELELDLDDEIDTEQKAPILDDELNYKTKAIEIPDSDDEDFDYEDDYEEEEKPKPMKRKKTAYDDSVSEVQFPNLDESFGQQLELDVFSNIPINLSVELGRSQISLKEVYELTEGSIIELERLVGEPLDLVVNGQVIAQGEVVAIDNNYGLRITNILSKVPVE